MNFKSVLVAFLLLSTFIETTIFSFPFVFILSILLYILLPNARVLFLVFFASFLIDILKASPPGLTALAVFASFMIIDLYRRVFEIKDYKIILLILFVFSYIYAKVALYSDNLVIYLVIFGGVGIVVAYFHKKKQFIW